MSRPGQPQKERGVRAPEESATGSAELPIDREHGGASLRLAIGKDGLGIELARPARVACLDLTELVVRLPRVRFPFDVSGGVAKFRHKRGELERLTVELDARHLARFASERLRGLIATGPCTVDVAPRRLGATITVSGRTTPSAAPSTLRVAALAFEVWAMPSGEDVVLVVASARGANVSAPPTTLAMRAMAALLGDAARREGSRFVLSKPAAALVRHVLPEAGVRAPSGDEMLLSGAGESDGVFVFGFARAGSPADVPEEGALASETALLARRSDDARFAGEIERARAFDVDALERAPRHPELVRRIVEIDAFAGSRAEAAMATLRSAARAPHVGVLAGSLLLAIGDVPGAIAALVREGERERSSVMGALAYAAAADASTDPFDALAHLDSAVARAPWLLELRWERARRRLLVGQREGANADLQELEAHASGARERLEVLRRAADLHRACGAGDVAADLYERALLYRPDDPEALAGLGAALAATGRAARGATLLAHAIEQAAAHGGAPVWMELELSKILAEGLRDLPAAIARVHAIADDAREAIEARALEGRWRARLGDVSGATIAFARLRERAGNEASAVPFLLEASRFESERGDVHAAHRHAAVAVAIAPRDETVLATYRALGERLARIAGLVAPSPAEAPVVPPPPSSEAKVTTSAPPLDEAAAEERVESLTRAIQADPSNDAAVDELAALLSRLGRGMELLALLSARLEDAPLDRRDALLPKHHAVLEQLEREAREAGRTVEADLYRMARDAS